MASSGSSVFEYSASKANGSNNVVPSKARVPFGIVNDNSRDSRNIAIGKLTLAKEGKWKSTFGKENILRHQTTLKNVFGNKKEEVSNTKLKFEGKPSMKTAVDKSSVSDKDVLQIKANAARRDIGEKKQISKADVTSKVSTKGTEDAKHISRTDNGNNTSKRVTIEKDYIMDNLNYLFQREKSSLLNPNYLKNHPTVNRKKRSTLVDWLVDVAHNYEYSEDALFLSISYIDCFLSRSDIKMSELQLLGVTALFIACKYEEPQGECLRLSECILLADRAYTRPQIREMEIRILKMLNFKLGMPTASTFLSIFSVLGKLTSKEITLAKYFVELSLVDGERTLRFLPSVQAASASLLGRCAAAKLKPSEVTTSKVFGYDLDRLRPCIDAMYELHRAAPQSKFQAVRVKYTGEKRHKSKIDTVH